METEIIQDERRWKLLKFKVLEQQIAQLFQLYRNAGIEPILIKGWAAGLYYPEHFQRIFSDIDLAVDPKDFDKAERLTSEKKITVDLHFGLRKLDTFAWDALFEKSVTKKIGQTEIRILSPEDHLRVLCVHWLMDGGAYKEKLWDIYYLIENRDKDFDWDRVLNQVSRKRRRWILLTIALVHKYLQLKIDDLPIKDELQHIPEWMIRTVEKEWRSDTLLRPLQTCLHNRKLFWAQIKKRIPPNMIQSTVEMDGEFDDSSRLKYQIGNIFQRLSPSIKRIFKTLKRSEPKSNIEL